MPLGSTPLNAFTTKLENANSWKYNPQANIKGKHIEEKSGT